MDCNNSFANKDQSQVINPTGETSKSGNIINEDASSSDGQLADVRILVVGDGEFSDLFLE